MKFGGTLSTILSVSPQNPAETIGEYQCTPPARLTQIVDRARLAQREWLHVGPHGRAAALASAAERLSEGREQVTDLIVREVGKPLTEAAGEVARGIAILAFYAQTSFAALGDVLPPSVGGSVLYTERRPHGVAGLITPWNFPIAIPLWKAAPALACGNAVVLKPSPECPGCAEVIQEILHAVLPEGLFSVVHGDADTGEALIAVADVISFTGSTAVGRSVAIDAARRGIAAQCEMGGQNAAIVLADAEVESTAAMLSSAIVGYAGQKCTSTRRVILVGGSSQIKEALITQLAAATPDDPSLPSTIVGPVISRNARDRISASVNGAAAQEGVRILVGGSQVDRSGWFYSPTLVDGLARGAALATEETFGPVASLHEVQTLDEAIDLVNGVSYGLVTSIHGGDLDQILRAIGAVDTGLIKVNAPTTGVDFYAPFGGEKLSSIGPREQGTPALDFYSSTRTITIAQQALRVRV